MQAVVLPNGMYIYEKISMHADMYWLSGYGCTILCEDKSAKLFSIT